MFAKQKKEKKVERSSTHYSGEEVNNKLQWSEGCKRLVSDKKLGLRSRYPGNQVKQLTFILGIQGTIVIHSGTHMEMESHHNGH